MSQSVKSPKSTYVILGAGFALGALCMAGMYSGTPAFAQLIGMPTRTISMTNRESMAELRNLDSSYENLADFVAPAVVDIRSTNGRQMGTNGERMPLSGGEGYGFVFRADGYIITNDHVVGGFDDVTVTLKNGRQFPGKVTRAQDSDIALVKIDAKDLPTLALADSSKVRPGQIVMAVGAPFGLQQSMSFGHISALGREDEIENRLYPDLIQTDAPINMGNSGGPLVNIDGQVVGVDTSILSPSGTSAGIGFAIPSNQVRFIAEMLVNKGKVTKSMLGLFPTNLKDYQRDDMHLPNGGALVESVSKDGPAAAAGIKKGDVIVKVGTTPITNELDLRNAMLVYAPGTSVPVSIVRDGQSMTLSLKLVEFKAPPAKENPFQDGNGQKFQLPKGFDFKQFGMPENPFGDNGMPNFGFPNDGGQGNSQSRPANPFSDGHPHLGVGVGNLTDDVRSQYNVPASVQGAVIEQVEPESVASEVGLQAGDVVTQFAGKAVASASDLTSAVKTIKHGDKVTIHFIRFSTAGRADFTKTATFK